MPLATVYTRAQVGLDAPLVTCEVHLSGGLPGLTIVGLVETAIKESRERVRAAIRQSGFRMPEGRITVNLAPADLPKAGSRFDLAIAIGILAASEQVPTKHLTQTEFYGELAFSGAVRSVRGLLPALRHAGDARHRCIVPDACRHESALLREVDSRCADHLVAVTRFLADRDTLPAAERTMVDSMTSAAAPDLADVRDQPQGRRALEVAAAGRHNLLMSGPPGTGKTMLARRLPGLLPDLTDEQMVENMLLKSLTGIAVERSCRPPFRAPHHTASAPALVGGGRVPRPGEISLAHNGVLFLDELPEFPRNVLESLREPLESGVVRVARAEGAMTFPASFQFVAAMNPCPCGFAGDTNHECRCTADQVQRYQQKISGPLLDRLQIRPRIGRCAPRLLQQNDTGGEDTGTVRARVLEAIGRQRKRSSVSNAMLSPEQVRRWCMPERGGATLLERAAKKYSLSLRACDDTLRVARSIADLAGTAVIGKAHVAEALALRGVDRRGWNGP